MQVSGVLHKHSTSNRTWKAHYAYVTKGHFFLCKTRGDPPFVEIALNANLQAQELRVTGRMFCFEVISPSRKLLFSAESEDMRMKWVTTLNGQASTTSSTSQCQDGKAHRNRRSSIKSKKRTHSFNVSGTTFSLHPKYKLIKPIGTGSYGVVISAQNLEDPSQKVAVKKVPRAFSDEVDAKRILREIRLLRHFDHENIIKILDIEPPPSLAEFDDVYIISDLMETDLHRVIYSRQNLTDDHIQYFLYQTLCALKYIHSAGVLHRDLKPSNILLNSDCHLKICDFGLARGVMPDTNKDLTEYVVTRWYRAPEIMLSCQDYKSAIDVWSVGCIFAEMLGRKPLFPGNDFIHQLNLINEIVGTPDEEDLEFITNVKARRFMTHQHKCARVPFDSLFKNANADAIDLLENMLVFSPDERITVEKALQHPYLESLHDPVDEPTCGTPFDFSFENGELKKPQLQRLIFEDCCHFHPEARLEEQERQSRRKQAINGK